MKNNNCVSGDLHCNYRDDFATVIAAPYGNGTVFLDNAATTQKPNIVVEEIFNFYKGINSGEQRGIQTAQHKLFSSYERSREKIAAFINAGDSREIVFSSGVTESINLVANSFITPSMRGGEVIVTEMEHHSNILPWQMVCAKHDMVLRMVPIGLSGELDLNVLKSMLSVKTKLVALAHISNTIGTVNDVKLITSLAHYVGAKVLIDGAQAVGRMPIDVQDIGCDFYVFSGHKVYGPTGTGVLFGKFDILNRMPAWQGGGGMVKDIHAGTAILKRAPYKFESGSPNFVGVFGLEAAIDHLTKIGMHKIHAHESMLTSYALQQLNYVSSIKILGCPNERLGVISFTISGGLLKAVAAELESYGLDLGVGHHCAIPLMEKYEVAESMRVSFAMYNSKSDVDALIKGLFRVCNNLRIAE